MKPDIIAAEFILITIAVILLLFVSFIFFLAVRKARAKQKVFDTSQKEKLTQLNQLLEPSGFQYDPKQDIFYSRRDCWQRQFGYCSLYDDAATGLSMVLDREPIYFEYNGKRWLLELWKGQYGMTTGCEIGLYNTDQPNVDIPDVFQGPFYESAEDDQQILMEFELKDSFGRTLFWRRELHWWLTGFSLGTFYQPEDLYMNVRLTFPCRAMATAFLSGLISRGYQPGEFLFRRTTVYLTFATPKAKPQAYRNTVLAPLMQNNNRFYCEEYHSLTDDFTHTLDKLTYLKQLSPRLYQTIFRFLHSEELYAGFQKIKEQGESYE